MNAQSNIPGFTIIENPSNEEMSEVQKGLEDYNMSQTNGEFNSPQPWLSLVLKDHDENIVGGLQTSTLYWTQYLEILWVDKKYRGRGYGKDLVLEGHRLAKNQGCVSSHTYTFSWQAPDFYQSVGYKIIAVYDGYVEGIKEYILMKRLDTIDDSTRDHDSDRFKIVEDSSEEAKKIVQRGLGSNFDAHAGKILEKYPQLGFNFIVRKDDGVIVGGITGYTTLGTMYTDELWIAEAFRRKGLGKAVLEKAEALAKERGCIANQSTCLTFQNLEFFKKMGFEFYGHTDAYPNGVIEYFLIKRF